VERVLRSGPTPPPHRRRGARGDGTRRRRTATTARGDGTRGMKCATQHAARSTPTRAWRARAHAAWPGGAHTSGLLVDRSSWLSLRASMPRSSANLPRSAHVARHAAHTWRATKRTRGTPRAAHGRRSAQPQFRRRRGRTHSASIAETSLFSAFSGNSGNSSASASPAPRGNGRLEILRAASARVECRVRPAVNAARAGRCRLRRASPRRGCVRACGGACTRQAPADARLRRATRTADHRQRTTRRRAETADGTGRRRGAEVAGPRQQAGE
jgi:hypothetical protein